VGNTVEKENDSMENGYGSQMGDTGREGFLELTLRGHPDDSHNYDNIGGKDNQEATRLTEYRNN
jgi:hypothetical protein